MTWPRGRGATRWVAKRTACHAGGEHPSRVEAARCNELHLLARAGDIRDLQIHPQPRLRLEVNGVHIGDYLPDAMYVVARTGERVVEDVKGQPGDTKVYRLKKRLVQACHGVQITEVRRGRR